MLKEVSIQTTPWQVASLRQPMITRRTRWFMMVGVVLVLLATCFCVLRFSPGIEPGFTEANLDRLYSGISLQQAELLLGPPLVVTTNGSCTKVTWASGKTDAQLFFNGPQGKQVLTAAFLIRWRGSAVERVPLHKPPLEEVLSWICR